MSAVERRLVALRRAAAAEVEDINRLIYHVLRAGIVLSVSFIVFAFVLSAATGGGVPDAAIPPRDLGREVVHLTPAGFLSLGILLMILTPMARVVLSLISYARERDALYVAITGLVLVNLFVGLLVGVA